MCLPSFISEVVWHSELGQEMSSVPPGGCGGGSVPLGRPTGPGPAPRAPRFSARFPFRSKGDARWKVLGEVVFILLGWYGGVFRTWARCCGKFPFARGRSSAGALAVGMKHSELGLDRRVAGEDPAGK